MILPPAEAGSKRVSATESSPARECRVGNGMSSLSPGGTAELSRLVIHCGPVNHTRVSLRVHCIFSTKDRANMIPADLQDRAWAFIGGIARRCGMTAIAVGGMADHVHILLLLPATVTLAAAVQKIKANSSRWVHEQTGKPFMWQEGYAAFSVGISQTDATVNYILHQKEHHERHGFGEELARILARHGMN